MTQIRVIVPMGPLPPLEEIARPAAAIVRHHKVTRETRSIPSPEGGHPITSN